MSGLQSEEDYRLYQRKRVLPHLMALYTAPCMDSKARVNTQVQSCFGVPTVCIYNVMYHCRHPVVTCIMRVCCLDFPVIQP